MAFHCFTRRCSVRNWPCWNLPGCRRCNSPKSAFTSRPGLTSRKALPSSHTSANGSLRVRHVWGFLVSLGTLPRRTYLRAVAWHMPALAAAAVIGTSFFTTNLKRRRTCSSVTISDVDWLEKFAHPPQKQLKCHYFQSELQVMGLQGGRRTPRSLCKPGNCEFGCQMARYRHNEAGITYNRNHAST